MTYHIGIVTEMS